MSPTPDHACRPAATPRTAPPHASCLLLAAVAVTPVAAQTGPLPPAGGATPTRLATVVVPGTTRQADAFDVPASVDSEDARRLDSLNVNISDALTTVPGLVARNRQNYAQDEQLSIRGFGARSTFGIRGVRLYFDGIPATMPDGQGQVSHVNLETAERIEVLRGPFSALYGNSSGGVVQVFTADGTEPTELRAGIAGGGNGTLRANLGARGIEGPFDYNVGFTHFQTDGERDHSAAQRESGNGKLRWTGDSGASLSLVVNTVNIPGAQDPLGLTREDFEADPTQVAAPAETFDTRKSVSQQQAGLVWEQPLGGGHSLRAMGYYGQRDVLQYLSIPVFVQTASPLQAGAVIDLQNEYGGGDARWMWDGELAGGALSLTAGVSRDRQRQHRYGYENFVGDTLGVRGALRRDQVDRVDSDDVYAQASWTFHPDWTLTAGARRSEIGFDSRDRYVTADNPDDSGRAEYAQTSPVAGLLWRVTPAANVYAAWGRGFETPTFSELGYRFDGSAGLAFDLVPARSRNSELGLKLRPRDGVAVDLALFHTETRDELAVATNNGGRTTYQNIDRSRRRGAEAAVDLDLAPAWRLRTALTWMQATFESPFLTCGGSGCTEPDTPVAAGSPIPGVPRRTASTVLAWEPAETGWRASAYGRYVDDVPTDDLGRDAADAYTVFDLSAGYVFDAGRSRIATFARVDNVFDRQYAGSVIVNDGNGRYFEPGLGRTLTVGADLRWR
ncbi:TonB-dependent receptor family protein [Coralloluteibacterium stylophorae]|uniref:TonB-dependent receptor n=1 Tax=Coralloluteibacterium stylophorae TaxID=1776034 RepID=A0A8J7VUI2_9GAMM|nr:TonB-dependent receptor [Coralloluteibacterium stylophorae]MBS7457861.1 TonB-dependent receptor [Coralloluteibacterium stylophorae]